MTTAAHVPAITVQREIAASADEIFDAWLDPDSVAVWMRPGSATHATATIDAREGGHFTIVMHTPNATVAHTGIYRTIDRPRRLVFSWISEGTARNETMVTVDFRSKGARTDVVITHELLPTAAAAASHTKGWSGVLEWLDRTIGAAPAS